MSERFGVAREGCDLAGERWPGGAPLLVLLHEGVSDRRGWYQVAERLAPRVTVVAYDRRGYGESPASTAPFTHAGDLLAILDRERAGPAWLAGASAGGGVALDTALLAPDRVAGLVLIGTAVSGAPDPELDPDTERFDGWLEAAGAAGDQAELNRVETWLWLDGPAQPEGRVGGEARALALDMNAIILRGEGREDEGDSGLDAVHPPAGTRLPGTPTAFRVRVHRRHVAEHRVHHLPGRFDGVLAGEQPPVPIQCRADEPVVGAHVRTGHLRERQFLRLGFPPGAGLLAGQD